MPLTCNFKAVDYQSFHTLSEKEKEVFVLENGVLLLTRQEPEFTIYLFSVDGFYVEVYYHQNRDCAILFKSFTDVKFLEPYMQLIDISEIL